MLKETEELQKLRDYWKKYGEIILAYGQVPVNDKQLGVGASTYRAYGKFLNRKSKSKQLQKPSDLMQGWVKERFAKLALTKTRHFGKFHKLARESLAGYWKATSGKKLPIFPYACKLLDLHIKHCIWHRKNKMGKQQQHDLLRVAFQPLDSYSLLLLRKLGVRRPNGEEILSKPLMGLVQSEREYTHLQKQIRRKCGKANVPRFAFDHYAWNSNS